MPPRARRVSVVDLAGKQNGLTWLSVSEALSESASAGELSLQVFARSRPASKKEIDQGSAECVDVDEASSTIACHPAAEGGPAATFKLDKVFGFQSSQQDVYEKIGVGLVSNCVQGFNTCIFAYGQTSSGKSHSMVGTKSDPGLIPRVCNGLYFCFDQLVSTPVGRDVSSVVIEASYYEIYNEKLQVS